MALFEQLNLNKLSAVEQEIYRFIVNHLEKIPYMRVRDIADDAHVEKAHFDAHPEHLGLEARIKGLNMQIFHPDAEYQIRKLAEAMRDADLILFMGMGASGAIAQYVARKLASLGYFSISIDELTYPIKSFLRKDQKNVLVFLSVSGETKELIEVITGLDNQAIVQKYCITPNRESTLARLCDYSIEYAIKEERKDIFLDLTSQLPSVAILETLIGYLQDYRTHS